MVGLSYQDTKSLLVEHQLRHFKLYLGAKRHQEKSYHFGAWRAIRKLEAEYTEEVKKKAGL